MTQKAAILVLNSDQAALSSISESLNNTIYSTIEYSSGAEALDYLRQNEPPALVLCDIHIDDINGWQFCRLLRSSEFSKTNDTPIIVSSPIFHHNEIAPLLHGIGADSFLALPCGRKELVQRITDRLSEKRSQTRPLAMVLEDEETMMKFLSTGLAAQGYEVIEAATCEEAARLAEENKPDIIVMDHMLPDGNSLDLLPDIKKDENSIIIAITAISDPELAISYSQAGANLFIRKPFTISYLADMINRTQREMILLRADKLFQERTRELKEAESRFRDLYENAPVGYHTISSDGTILSMNQTELNWLGYKKEEVVNKLSIFDLQTAASASKGKHLLNELKKSGTLRDVELEFVRKNGTRLPVLIESSVDTRSGTEAGSFRTTVRDISDRRRLEHQLRHAQKMESLGIMANGIAHNFNNLLTPILINATDMINDFPEDSDEHAVFKDIIEAGRRGSELVKQLITVGKKSESFGLINIDKLLEETAEVLKKTFDKSIIIVINIKTSVSEIIGDESQLQQAIFNICFNSQDAMPEGGMLTIELSEEAITEETAEVSTMAKAGRYLTISVADTGSGMSPDVAKMVFDPFFTTKGLANRTGLGLSTAYGIARDHGGFIHLRTQPELGSKFTIYLPIPTESDKKSTAPTVDPAAKAVQVEEDIDQQTSEEGAKCILIIDDEADLLRSASRSLRKSGYKVLTAEDGITGIDLIRKARLPDSKMSASASEEQIDLVILDVAMPKMPGEKVLEQIRGISDELPVIIASGYGETERITDFLHKGAQSIIAKPFEGKGLLEVIQEVLNSQGK